MKRFQSVGLMLALLVGLVFNFTPAFAANAAPAFHFRTYTVNIGAEDAAMGIDINQFFPSHLRIHAGDTVLWRLRTNEIHTVTFLANLTGLPCVPAPSASTGGSMTNSTSMNSPNSSSSSSSSSSTGSSTCVTSMPAQPGMTGPNLPPFAVPVTGMASPVAINQIAALAVIPADGDYDGSTFANSGIMGRGPGQPQTFSLRFMKTGSFTYYCLVHGAMMSGTIEVVANSVVNPTPEQVNAQAGTDEATQMVNATNTLHTLFNKVPAPVKNTDGTTTYHVLMGMMVGNADYMRFFPRSLAVHPGDKIVWSFGMGNDEPHTVTFLNGAAEPDLITPVNQQNGPPVFLLNSQVVLPSANAGQPLTSKGYVNSGLLTPGQGPQTFTLTIGQNASGTLNYVCLLHDTSGMIGQLVVTPK